MNNQFTPPHPEKRRVKWIDALRGFSMFFVVYYHIQAISVGVHVSQSVLGSILLSFRMPMFFFVSGFIAYKGWQFWTKSFYLERLKNKARVQLIPTFVFFSLSVMFAGGTNPFAAYLTNGLGGFWFTFVLFEFFIVYFTISFVCKFLKGKCFDVIAAVLSAGAVAYFALYKQENTLWWTMLSLTPFLKYLQFFFLGVLCRKYKEKLFDLLSHDWFITVNIIVFVISIFLICSSIDIKAEYGFGGSFINDELVRYAGLFIVLTCFYKNREYFDKDNIPTKVLCLMGRRSLDIYMIHNFLLPHLTFIKPLFLDKYNITLEFWILVALTTLVVAFAIIIGAVLRNSRFLGHYLLGAK